MSGPSPIADRMREKLIAKFSPQKLEIIDESHNHAGHAGHDPRGESHFRILIVADAFGKLPRVERHRMIYLTLERELTDRIHALQIKALDPSEFIHTPS